MKNLIILLLMTALVYSCETEKQQNESMYVDATVDMYILDKQGHDMLNPGTIGHYNFEDLKLFYLVHGTLVEVYDTLAAKFSGGTPRNLMQFQDSTHYVLRCFTNVYFPDLEDVKVIDGKTYGRSTAYLQLSPTDFDTIESEVIKWPGEGECLLFNSKVLINGKEYKGSENGLPFKLIKDR